MNREDMKQKITNRKEVANPVGQLRTGVLGRSFARMKIDGYVPQTGALYKNMVDQRLYKNSFL